MDYGNLFDREIDERIADEIRESRTVQRGLYAPYAGATIDRDGEAWFGTHHCEGIYIADPDLARRAQRALIERDFIEATRRNDWLERQRVRFELTDAGRAAVAGGVSRQAA